jgi:peptide/nickel transport system substrate-binding protein
VDEHLNSLTHLSRRNLLKGAGAGAALVFVGSATIGCSNESDGTSADTTSPESGADNSTDGEGTTSAGRGVFLASYVDQLHDVTQAVVPGVATMFAPSLEPLLLIQPDGALGPNLATEFAQPDETTIVLTIRQGVTFWNGEALTLDDIVYSLTLHNIPEEASFYSEDTAIMESVEPSGTDQIIISLSSPDPQFVSVLALLGIVQRTSREALGDARGTTGNLNVGTGPYKVVDFVPADHISYVRNETYWGTAAIFDELEIVDIREEATALAAMQTGELTGTFNVPTPQLGQYEAIDGVTLYRAPDTEILAMLAMNPNLAPFDDLNVRRAVSHAVDKQSMVDAVLGGSGVVADTVVSPAILYGLLPTDEVDAALREMALDFDLDLARQLIAESAYPDGFDVTAITSDAEPDLRVFGLAMADMLAEIGINLTIEEVPVLEYDALVFSQDERTQALVLASFSQVIPTPYNQPRNLLWSRNAPPTGYANLAGVKDPELDAILEEINATDPAERETVGRLMLDLLALNSERAYYQPIGYGEALLALGPGYTFDSFGPFWPISAWFQQVQPS